MEIEQFWSSFPLPEVGSHILLIVFQNCSVTGKADTDIPLTQMQSMHYREGCAHLHSTKLIHKPKEFLP